MTTARLGRVLKALREENEWTLKDLAKKAKVTQAYISLLERGKKKNPTLAILQHLAKALGVSVAELVE